MLAQHSRPVGARRLFAAPAAIVLALALALAGAVVVAGPANAAPVTLVVTAPLAGATVTSRTFDVTGTGTDGGVVGVTDGTAILGTTTVGLVSPGVWSVTVTFPETAATAQTLTVAQLDPSDLADPAAGTVTLAITLPAAVAADPAGPIVVDVPVDGSTLTSRTVDFAGSAPVGSFVTASLLGQVVTSTTIAAGGAFAFTLPFPFALGDTVTVTFAGTDAAGVALVPVDVSFDLPAPVAAPVITAPVTGSTTTGTSVTFSGTGIVGDNIALVILPADAATTTALAALDPAAFTAPITVGAAGTWSVTYSLVLGSFTATALHTSAAVGDAAPEALSGSSNSVAFVLAAPVVTTVVRPAELAATGATTDALVGPGALLLGAGLLLVLAARRRAARR